jgi:hypothetical protein
MIYKQKFNIIYIYSLPEPFQDKVKEYFEGLEDILGTLKVLNK